MIKFPNFFFQIILLKFYLHKLVIFFLSLIHNKDQTISLSVSNLIMNLKFLHNSFNTVVQWTISKINLLIIIIHYLFLKVLNTLFH